MSETDERNYEQEARDMGWVPLDEWNGDPDNHRSAEDFVRRGEEILPIVNAQNKDLRENNKALEDRLAKMQGDVDMIAKVAQQQVKDAEQAGYDKAKVKYEEKLEALQKKKFEAVQEGDLETFQQAEGEIANLQPPTAPAANSEPKSNDGQPAVAGTPPSNPAFDAWHKENSWYINDPANPGEGDHDLSAYANGLVASVAPKHDMTTQEGAKACYEEIAEKVKQMFPQKFENPNRNEPGMTQPGSTGPGKGGKGKTTWADLPDSAKQAFERQKKMMEEKGFSFTKEQYLKAYEAM